MASTASSSAIPTKPSGYVEDSTYWSAALSEFGEQVPDLIWPTSNWTYAQMRRDPQLAAVLKAYTLPIRRASWSIDPAGCRDEVVKLVSEDMGLPIKGVEDDGAAARVRGVSWREHLRSALLSLTFGHMGFESLATIDDSGQARLTSLSERMPYTIGDIRINPDGSLAGIDQILRPVFGKQPLITADRLVWYVNEREGAAWQGTSLMRPAFAPWLFKREMQRVLATSNRRFGMGVPTVRALPGTVPTQAQEQQAQLLASSVRVGEQGGASIPPGYVMELIGLSGSVPDTMAFINWLNQEMSRMALAGWLDLGNTPNGSRALGDSFIDIFLLALQSISDDIADVATRQISARIVDWNWGPDEPVPAVSNGDVGSSHEITAEAISALVRFGALQPDPALDAFLRREWKIPARTVPYEEPLPAPTPIQPLSPHAGARRVRKSKASADQPMLPFAAAAGSLRRDLTSVEAASGADFDSIQQQWQDAKTALVAQWPTLATPAVSALALAAGQAVESGQLADLGVLALDAATLAPIEAAVAAAMMALATRAAQDVVDEAETQGVTLTPGVVDSDRISEAAEAAVGVILGGYANGAARTAMLLAAPGATAAVVAAAVTTSLAAMSTSGDTGWVATNLSSALSVAQHEGRMATISAADEPPALTASEVLDAAVCGPCEEIDGTEFPDITAALDAYPTGRYRNCLGADRCRGILVATWAPRGDRHA